MENHRYNQTGLVESQTKGTESIPRNEEPKQGCL